MTLSEDRYFERYAKFISEAEGTPQRITSADDLDNFDVLVLSGHVWKFVESSDGNFYTWIRCYIHLGEEYDHFVSQLIPI